MTIIDSRELPARDGFTLRAHIEPDYDVSTDDSDCYTPKQVAAFQDGSWDYVGVVVTASRGGVDLGSASIWGTEHGLYTLTDEDDNELGSKWIDPLDTSDEGSTINYYGPDLIDEAIAEARATIEKINEVPA